MFRGFVQACLSYALLLNAIGIKNTSNIKKNAWIRHLLLDDSKHIMMSKVDPVLVAMSCWADSAETGGQIRIRRVKLVLVATVGMHN